MGPLAEHTLTVFMAFFAIMNPVANTAIFAGLTAELNRAEQKKIAIKALTITFIIIFFFSLLGQYIFQLFGLTLPALRIGGGIIVFIVGLHMLQGSHSSLHNAKESEDADLAVSPLAVPILAGPGTIATAMNYSATGSWVEITITIASFAVLCLITTFCFIFSAKILDLVGKSGLSIMTRLMGLLLAVMGVQMILVGIQAVRHIA